MEITFVWSWFSFIVGSLSAIFAAFLLMMVFAFKQWKKQKQQKEEAEKTFSFSVPRWDNSAL
jgi:formiminotetrahydrofolate cyclodeaminase